MPAAKFNDSCICQFSRYNPAFIVGEKVGVWKLQFSGRQMQISNVRRDHVPKNFNFAPKFPKFGDSGFPVRNFVFLEENSPTG